MSLLEMEEMLFELEELTDDENTEALFMFNYKDDTLYTSLMELEEVINNCDLVINSVNTFGMTKQLFHFINNEDYANFNISSAITKELPSAKNNYDLNVINKKEFIIEVEELKLSTMQRIKEVIANFFKYLYAKFQLFYTSVTGTIDLIDKIKKSKEKLKPFEKLNVIDMYMFVSGESKQVIPAKNIDSIFDLYCDTAKFFIYFLNTYMEDIANKKKLDESFKDIISLISVDRVKEQIKKFNEVFVDNKITMTDAGKFTMLSYDIKVVTAPIRYGQHGWTLDKIKTTLIGVGELLSTLKPLLEKGVKNLMTYQRQVKDVVITDDKTRITMLLNLPRLCYRVVFVIVQNIALKIKVLLSAYNRCVE